MFVATQNNTVYALDADAQSPPLWQVSTTPDKETVLSNADLTYEGRTCGDIVPTIGITSTPVIDIQTMTVYVVAKTKRSQNGTSTFHHYLYAINITNGNVKRTTEISPTFAGTQILPSALIAGNAKPEELIFYAAKLLKVIDIISQLLVNFRI